MSGYENVTLDTSILKGVSYTATITTDLANSKEVKADLSFTAGGKTYTVDTATDYMNAVYDSLESQVEAAVDQKVKDLAKQYGMTEDEVRANADFDIAGDLAALKAETDKLGSKIDTVKKKYDAAKNLSTATKTYGTADEAIAAGVNYAVKKGIQSAANLPTTVNGLVGKYGAQFDKAVSSVNSSLQDARRKC